MNQPMQGCPNALTRLLEENLGSGSTHEDFDQALAKPKVCEDVTFS